MHMSTWPHALKLKGRQLEQLAHNFAEANNKLGGGDAPGPIDRPSGGPTTGRSAATTAPPSSAQRQAKIEAAQERRRKSHHLPAVKPLAWEDDQWRCATEDPTFGYGQGAHKSRHGLVTAYAMKGRWVCYEKLLADFAGTAAGIIGRFGLAALHSKVYDETDCSRAVLTLTRLNTGASSFGRNDLLPASVELGPDLEDELKSAVGSAAFLRASSGQTDVNRRTQGGWNYEVVPLLVYTKAAALRRDKLFRVGPISYKGETVQPYVTRALQHAAAVRALALALCSVIRAQAADAGKGGSSPGEGRAAARALQQAQSAESGRQIDAQSRFFRELGASTWYHAELIALLAEVTRDPELDGIVLAAAVNNASSLATGQLGVGQNRWQREVYMITEANLLLAKFEALRLEASESGAAAASAAGEEADGGAGGGGTAGGGGS